MTDQASPIDPANIGQPIGFCVDAERLCMIVKIGTDTITAQLTPQMAIELARDLLVPGLAHAEARAMQRVNADTIAAGAIGKASH